VTCCSRRWRQDGALAGHPGPKEAGVIGSSLSRSEGELPLTHIRLFYFLVLAKDIFFLSSLPCTYNIHAVRDRETDRQREKEREGGGK